jgi:hypothetical protein
VASPKFASRLPMNNVHRTRQRFGASDAYALSLGLLSLACGGAMLAAPRLFGALFMLPRHRTLVQLLGARDVLIGSALLVPASRRLALALRSLADTGDGVMIATEIARDKDKAVRGGLSLAFAGLSAATSMRLALREATSQ